jgi:hypothetical protein
MCWASSGRDPNRVVIVGAHIDSRVTDVMDATSDAPGPMTTPRAWRWC